MKRKFAAMLLGAVVMLAAACTRAQPPGNPQAPVLTPAASPSPEGTTAAPARVGPNFVYVTDQKPGATVTIAQLGLASAGYVVIHESSDGKPDAITGASALLTAGDHGDVVITLTKPATDGQTFFAMLHQDDGDGTFDATKDLPVKDPFGNTMMMEFSIAEDAEDPGPVQF